MFDELSVADKRYSEAFSLAGLAATSARRLALLSCINSKIEALTMLGLIPGDAKIIRNAEGSVTSDVLRSLLFATAFLGVKRPSSRGTQSARTLLRDSDVHHVAAAGLDLGDEPFHTVADPDKSLSRDVDVVCSLRSIPPGLRWKGGAEVDDGSVRRIVFFSLEYLR